MFCTASAHAPDLALFAGSFSAAWYNEPRLAKDLGTITANTRHRYRTVRVFDDGTLDEFQAWVESNAADGELDVIWLTGSMPSLLWPEEKPVSRARRWLNAGNMFINVGQRFAFQSHECGGPCPENGDEAATDILGLGVNPFLFAIQAPAAVEVNVFFSKTETGERFMPRLCDRPVTSFPVAVAEIVRDPEWEVATVFGSDDGTDTGKLADPVVLHNTKSHGYLAIISQTGWGMWCDRGDASSDLLDLWGPQHAVGDAVSAKRKLVISWAALKAEA